MRRTLSLVTFLLPLNLWSAPNPQMISIMSYNVFNLFDAKHDEGKDDWTFLPKVYPGKTEQCKKISNSYYREECLNSDWTEKHAARKIEQIAKAVRAASENELPDMLALIEVENEEIVTNLAQKLNYDSVEITNSPDERGIDVALIFNEKADLRQLKTKEHEIKGTDKPTRNILEVEFAAGDEKLHIFVNHWPSQSAPAEIRVAVAKQLQKILDACLQSNPNANILVLGDFNTINADQPNPFYAVTMSQNEKNPLLDTYDIFMKSTAPTATKQSMQIGSYFYPPDMSWNRLDRIFVNKNLNDHKGLEVRRDSFRILSPELITNDYHYSNPQYASYGSVITGTPYRGNIKATTESEAGFSDHFPVMVKLQFDEIKGTEIAPKRQP